MLIFAALATAGQKTQKQNRETLSERNASTQESPQKKAGAEGAKISEKSKAPSKPKGVRIVIEKPKAKEGKNNDR